MRAIFLSQELPGLSPGPFSVSTLEPFPLSFPRACFLFFFNIFKIKHFFITVQLHLSSYSPNHSKPHQPNPPPSSTSTLPLGFLHVSFIVVPEKPLSQLSPPHNPMVIARLFLTSMSLVIFCLLFSFVDYVSVKGEIIWYLSLTVWLISLTIMLSSSIHAVAKGISSFFLSAV